MTSPSIYHPIYKPFFIFQLKTTVDLDLKSKIYDAALDIVYPVSKSKFPNIPKSMLQSSNPPCHTLF